MPSTDKQVVLTGTWIYDQSVTKPVYIVRTNFDFFYELAKEEDQLEPEERPDLNPEAMLYYVSFKGVGPDGAFWPDSHGHVTIEEAKTTARSKVPSDIQWQSV